MAANAPAVRTRRRPPPLGAADAVQGRWPARPRPGSRAPRSLNPSVSDLMAVAREADVSRRRLFPYWVRDRRTLNASSVRRQDGGEARRLGEPLPPRRTLPTRGCGPGRDAPRACCAARRRKRAARRAARQRRRPLRPPRRVDARRAPPSRASPHAEPARARSRSMPLGRRAAGRRSIRRRAAAAAAEARTRGRTPTAARSPRAAVQTPKRGERGVGRATSWARRHAPAPWRSAEHAEKRRRSTMRGASHGGRVRSSRVHHALVVGAGRAPRARR